MFAALQVCYQSRTRALEVYKPWFAAMRYDSHLNRMVMDQSPFFDPNKDIIDLSRIQWHENRNILQEFVQYYTTQEVQAIKFIRLPKEWLADEYSTVPPYVTQIPRGSGKSAIDDLRQFTGLEEIIIVVPYLEMRKIDEWTVYFDFERWRNPQGEVNKAFRRGVVGAFRVQDAPWHARMQREDGKDLVVRFEFEKITELGPLRTFTRPIMHRPSWI